MCLLLPGRVTLRGLDAQQQLEKIELAMQHANLLPSGSGMNPVRGMLNVLVADEEALSHYQAKSQRSLPIVLFYASSNWEAFPTLVANTSNTTFGWQHLTTQPVITHKVEGDHTSMLVMPHVQELAAALETYLAKTLAHPGCEL